MRSLIASTRAAIGLVHLKVRVAAWLGGTALAALLCAGVPSAHADFISTLNTGPGGTTGTTFGTVDVALNADGTALVTFTAAPGFFFIDSSIADVQVNASTFTITGFSATAAPFSTGTAANLSFGGSGQVDGFGVFNGTNNNMDGTAQALSEVDFTITDTSSATGFASADTVLTQNDHLFDAAAHVVVCSGDVRLCGNNSTFFVAEFPGGSSGVPIIPEPGTLFILGSGLAGLALLRRYVLRA